MIPRLKPFAGKEELFALLERVPNAVEKFEEKFAAAFGTSLAIAFPYGRSALWAFLKAMRIEDAEVVQPAYTCSVVGHATVLSGNRPRFVDCNLRDYNMDLDLLERAITGRTRMVIPTHIFGYPMDVNRVDQIVRDAENRYGQRIYIIQDCAHSFDAEWQGESVIKAGDGALFGLGISKQITSIFGGMLTTDDEDIAANLIAFRDENFSRKSLFEIIRRALYLSASLAAFENTMYGLTYWLQERTSLLKGLTDAYHLDQKIHFPPDHDHSLSSLEARVGLRQLEKYAFIKRRRREIAGFYFEKLKVPSGWVLPPRVEGATYSHFAIRVPDRDLVLEVSAREGVQLGQLIEYSMPHLPAYRQYGEGQEFPNSLLCSQSMINLPIHPSLNEKDMVKITDVINRIAQR